MTPLRRQYIQDMQLAGLASTTQDIYVACILKFARYHGKSPAELELVDIRGYQRHLLEEGASASTLRQVAAAMKFLYRVTLDRDYRPEQIPSTPAKTPLPTVLSRSEVVRFLMAVDGCRYRLLFMLLYSAGLRVYEVTHLSVADLDLDRMTIKVRFGKGGKSRYTVLSPRVIPVLNQYVEVADLTDWLFPGHEPGQPMTTSTVRRVCSRIATKAGIKKNVTPHVFRHTFATHALENGVDLRRIQVLLGHSSLLSTAIYLKVSPAKDGNTSSPLDELDF